VIKQPKLRPYLFEEGQLLHQRDTAAEDYHGRRRSEREVFDVTLLDLRLKQNTL
jgi:hypothetical protein